MFNSLVEPGLYIISDTYLCDGTGALMLLLRNIGKKVSFISDPGNYSHFNVLFKKNGLHVNYYELSCNLEIGDLPMTEDPPITWLDASKRIEISNILLEISKNMQPVIVIEDVFTILMEKGEKECVSLINSLREVCEILIIKSNEMIIKKLWMIDMNADVNIEIGELESGYTSDYQGKIRVFFKQNYIKSEIGCFWFKIVNDNFEIIES